MVDDVQLCRETFNAQDGLFQRGLTINARALFAITPSLATATDRGDAIEWATMALRRIVCSSLRGRTSRQRPPPAKGDSALQGLGAIQRSWHTTASMPSVDSGRAAASRPLRSTGFEQRGRPSWGFQGSSRPQWRSCPLRPADDRFLAKSLFSPPYYRPHPSRCRRLGLADL